MYCIHNGAVCVMALNAVTDQWEYIPLKKWLSMSDSKRSKYSTDR